MAQTFKKNELTKEERKYVLKWLSWVIVQVSEKDQLPKEQRKNVLKGLRMLMVQNFQKRPTGKRRDFYD